MPVFLNPRGFKDAMGQHPYVSVDGWPDPHLIARPNDALGQAIIDYAKKWKDHPDFPESPWDPRRGEIFLRDLDEPEAPPDDAQPLYRVVAPTAFIGPALYARGAVAALHGWPLNLSDIEPANESARRVVSYKTRYGLGRRMMEPPYAAGRLHFENPALWGIPLNATHTGTLGNAA
jgi:hypothetical protein